MNMYSSMGKCLLYLYSFVICLRCPFQGATLYDDSVDMVIVMSNLPSVTSHCAVPIIDMYFAFTFQIQILNHLMLSDLL